MSREIPMDQPLTEEDRAYLHARGQHATVEMLDEKYPADADAEEAEAEEETGDNYDDTTAWKVADLQAELKRRELPASGNRAELVARLRESDAAEE